MKPMNRAQYKIVKFFLGMGGTSEQISIYFRIPKVHVTTVEVSINYEMYIEMVGYAKGGIF